MILPKHIINWLYGSAGTANFPGHVDTDALNRLFRFLEPQEALRLSGTNRSLRLALYLNHPGSLGIAALPAFFDSNYPRPPLDKDVFSLLQIKAACFNYALDAEERQAALRAAIPRILMHCYDSKIKSSHANLAMVYLFERMLEAGVDFFQIRRQNPKYACFDYSLHQSLVFMAEESGNVRLLCRLLQVFPTQTVKFLRWTETAEEALCQFYDSDFEAFMHVITDSLNSLALHHFYHVFLGKDRQGTSFLFAFINGLEPSKQEILLEHLFDLDSASLSDQEKQQIWHRNRHVFEVLGLEGRGQREAFEFVNDLCYGVEPVDHAAIEAQASDLLPQLRLPFAKAAAKHGHFFEALLDWNYSSNSPGDFHLKKLKKRQKEFGAMLDDQFPEFEIQRLLAEHPSKSIKSILGVPEVDVWYRARIAFLYAEPLREVFDLVLRDKQLERSLVRGLFQLLLMIRSGKEDLITWMTALIDFAVERGFVLRGNSASAFLDLSVLSIPQVYQFLAHPRLSQFLGSTPAKQAILYTNYDSIFDYCIRTPQFFKQIMANPFNAFGFNPPNSTEFRNLLVRCDTRMAVERLFELFGKFLGPQYLPELHTQMLETLKENSVDRIGTMKGLLLYWRSIDPVQFVTDCPPEWQEAMK